MSRAQSQASRTRHPAAGQPVERFAYRDPVDVVDGALAYVGARRLLNRSEVHAVAALLRDASCGEAAVAVAEFSFWAWAHSDDPTPALPIVDALLDIRLLLSAQLAPV